MAAGSTGPSHFSYSSLEPVATYVLRQTLTSQITNKLQGPETGRRKLVVLSGLAGCGKTQLALDYLQQFQSSYDATFWVEAGTREALERDFISLHQTIPHEERLATTNPISSDAALVAVKAWFSRQQGTYLMVFDGANHIEDENSSCYIDIKKFLPNAPKLHVIITSRSTSVMDISPLRGVIVGRMEPEQAVELFRRSLRLPQTDRTVETDVVAIVEKLGCVALAVATAGTRVAKSPRLQSNIVDYLCEDEEIDDLLRQKPERFVHAYGESLHSVWEDTLETAGKACPGVVTLISIISFLHCDDISPCLLEPLPKTPESNVSESEGSSSSWKSQLPGNPFSSIQTMESCLQTLEKHTLVHWNKARGSYFMSELVQRWVRGRLLPPDRQSFCLAALQLAVEAVVGCGPTPGDKIRLVPHVMANFSELSRLKPNQLTFDKLDAVGEFLRDCGRPQETKAVQSYVVENRKHLLGAEHQKTLAAMGSLALSLGDLGEFKEAHALITDVVRCRRSTLGGDHPVTIGAVNSLVGILRGRGQLLDATRLNEDLLKRCCRTLGEEHPDTVGVRGSLATLYGELGDLRTAIALQEEVSEKRGVAYGTDHPKTLRAHHRLAVLYGKNKQYQESVTILEKVVQNMKENLGEDHPDTINATSNQADVLVKLGRQNRALVMKQEVLEKWKRVLGDEHPHTVGALSSLADTHEDLGELDVAIDMATKVVEVRTRTLGEAHSATVTARQTRAALLQRLELSNIVALPETIIQRKKVDMSSGVFPAHGTKQVSVWARIFRRSN